VSGSGISWARCKSAPRSRQITTPAHQRSVCYRPDAPPAVQPTASKHKRSLQSDQNLRGPHVARQQQLSIDICCGPRPTSAANPPAVDGRNKTDGRTLLRFMTLTAYYADRVINTTITPQTTSTSVPNAEYGGLKLYKNLLLKLSLSSRVVSASDCGVRGSRFESRRWQLCLSRQLLQYTVLSMGCASLLQSLGRLSLPPFVGR